jgi:hypothetical protein
MAGGIGMIGKVGFGVGEIYPIVTDTVDGIFYGRVTSFEGSLDVSDLPSDVDVLDTAFVGGSPGRWATAPEAKVEKDYDYGIDGTSETGTLEGGSGDAGCGVLYKTLFN